jgi:hypothetical protein
MKESLVLLAVSLPCVAQTTWFVAPGGFPTVQAAIAAASPGDRIEVSGFPSVPGFLVDKGVDVMAASPVLVPTIQVVGVPAGQRARVSGFRLDHQVHGHVSVRNCSGAVLLAELGSGNPSGTTPPIADPALEIVGSAAVFVSRCVLRGNIGTLAGSPAVRIDAANVVLTDGIAIGGSTRSSTAGVGDSGCTGFEVLGGDVTIGEYHIEGGPASAGTTASGTGGTGLHVVAGQVLVAASQIAFGLGSSPPVLAATGSFRRTSDTALLMGGGPAVVTVPARPSLQALASVGIGAQLTIACGSMFTPNEPMFLGFDFAHGHLPFPAFDGVLTLTPSTVLLTVIALDASGYGSLVVTIPLTPAAQHQDLFVQGLCNAGGVPVLTVPSVTRIR